MVHLPNVIEFITIAAITVIVVTTISARVAVYLSLILTEPSFLLLTLIKL